MSKVNGVGIAFCGGGFRSYAEVAVVEDLAREGIITTRIAGGLLLGYNPEKPARDSSPWPSLRSGPMAA